MTILERAWYQGRLWVWLLLPFSLLFWLISRLRRQAYQWGWLAAKDVPVPVIIIGNISVGGNGKTPLVIYLAKWLQQQGYCPGVLSRGYGGKNASYPMTVETDSSTAIAGDEPVLMRQHINCPLVVDPIRHRGAMHLLQQHQCDVILCDDGLQHYALRRDIEVVVVDGKRRFGNGMLLPMGPLREGKWRLKQADFVVVNGGVAAVDEHLMTLQPGALVNLSQPEKTMPLSAVEQPVVAAAAIGNPERFFQLLRHNQVRVKQSLTFADHHDFVAADLPYSRVLMTEKDAVKCRRFAQPDWWYLPVEAELPAAFTQALMNKLQQLGAARGRCDKR